MLVGLELDAGSCRPARTATGRGRLRSGSFMRGGSAVRRSRAITVLRPAAAGGDVALLGEVDEPAVVEVDVQRVDEPVAVALDLRRRCRGAQPPASSTTLAMLAGRVARGARATSRIRGAWRSRWAILVPAAHCGELGELVGRWVAVRVRSACSYSARSARSIVAGSVMPPTDEPRGQVLQVVVALARDRPRPSLGGHGPAAGRPAERWRAWVEDGGQLVRRPGFVQPRVRFPDGMDAGGATT